MNYVRSSRNRLRRTYSQRVLVPAVENDNGGLVTGPRREWLPVTGPVQNELLYIVRNDLRPTPIQRPLSKGAAQNCLDFESAIHHRPGDPGPSVSGQLLPRPAAGIPGRARHRAHEHRVGEGDDRVEDHSEPLRQVIGVDPTPPAEPSRLAESGVGIEDLGKRVDRRLAMAGHLVNRVSQIISCHDMLPRQTPHVSEVTPARVRRAALNRGHDLLGVDHVYRVATQLDRLAAAEPRHGHGGW